MSLENFKKLSIETCEMNKVFGGRYEKSGCGSFKEGSVTVHYKCDAVDVGGKRPTVYYGTTVQM
jgi:hypothetical protein